MAESEGVSVAYQVKSLILCHLLVLPLLIGLLSFILQIIWFICHTSYASISPNLVPLGTSGPKIEHL